jgi:hypothetical protein
MAYSVFRVPNGVAVSPTGVAQVVSIIQAFSGGGQTADLQQWQSSAGTVLARIDSAGNISGVAISGTTANFSSNLTVLGNTVLGDAVGDTITVSGTPTFVQNATFSGDIAVNGGDITTTAGTFLLAPANATAINIGSTSSTTNVNILSASGTINANGGTIASTASTMNLFNSTTTSNVVNISTAANTSGVVNVLTNATSGTINLGNSTTNTIVQGNLIVNGTTTTVNSTIINIDDLNLNLASDSGTLSTVDGGGITVGSGLGITLNYDNANTSWTSSQNFNIATTKTYKIAGTDVLNATGIGAGVIVSNLQRVGTIATGVWQGTSISTTYTDAKVASVAVAGTGLLINTNTGAVTITSNATSANTVSTLVARDSAGNFSAGTITATLTGTATQVSNNLTIGSGLASTSATYNGGSAVSVGLAPITQGTNGATFAKVTLDAYGRVTATGVVASGDIPNHSAAQITAGTLAVAQGGTNLGSYGTGVLLQASGTTISQLSPTTSGLFLRTNGANTFSTYSALTSSDVTTALGFTPANSSSGITGSGAAGRLTIWNTAGEVTSDIDLVYSTSSNTLSIAHGNITASSNPITIGTTGSDEIDNFTKTSYRTAKYLIQVANSISGPAEFQVSEVLVVHDGTTAYLTEYGKMYTGANPLLTSITVSIVGGTNVSLKAAAAAAGAIVRFTKITMNN